MTNRIIKTVSFILIFFCISSCKKEMTTPLINLETDLLKQIQSIEGDIAMAFLDLTGTKDSLFINIEEEFHAASTMKVPVMIELFKQAAEGKLNLQDSIVLKNEFKSIVDDSAYSMDIADDSDDVIYSKIGTKIILYDLMVPMITVSSNLATNVLIELVDAKKVTETMRVLGASKINVLRGVEDQKAYDLGLSNSTTARDLLVIMKAIADGAAGTKADCENMLSILKEQQWNDMIPLYLPKDIEIAHKTGSITGVHHDAAIVYLTNGKSYVLILLSKNLQDFNQGTKQLAQISKTIYDYMVNELN